MDEIDEKPSLSRWLFTISRAGVPPIFVIVNAACACILVWLPYTILVEFSMLLSVPSILLFMYSFVALRVKRPETERPFLIPGETIQIHKRRFLVLPDQHPSIGFCHHAPDLA